MIRSSMYGAAARVFCECDDDGGIEPAQAFALYAERSCGSGRLSKNAGEMPTARRNAAFAANGPRTRDAVEALVALAKIVAVPRSRFLRAWR